jgi:hypothetical protein
MSGARQTSYDPANGRAVRNNDPSHHFCDERSRGVSGIKGGWSSNINPARTASGDTSFAKANKYRSSPVGDRAGGK